MDPDGQETSSRVERGRPSRQETETYDWNWAAPGGTISTQLGLRAGATYCDYSTAYSTDIRALGSLPFPVLDHGFFPGGLAPINECLS